MHMLLEELVPVVEARTMRVVRRATARFRASGNEHADLVQESFARLFANGGKALLEWTPEHGMSLRNWAGMIVERALLTYLHRASVKLEYLDDVDVGRFTRDDPMALIEARSELVCLAARLRENLPTDRLELFVQLCMLREQVSDAARDTGFSEKALYAARRRLEKLARNLVRDA